MLTLGDPGYDIWNRFSRGRDSSSDHPVVARWKRVQQIRRTIGPLAGRESPLTPTWEQRRTCLATVARRCEDLLLGTASEMQRRGCVLALADAQGAVRGLYGNDVVHARFAGAGLTEGSLWDERARGTNAIGTSLAEDRAIAVIGRAHYDERDHGLVCYAAPIHDVRGTLLAVVDVTGPVQAADPLIGVTVQNLAAAIEGSLHARTIEQLTRELDETRQDETAALRAKEQLVATLWENEKFLAMVGHDLRTPVTAVLSGAELLLRQRDDTSISRSAAERIRSSGWRMVRMIDELFDFARLRLGDGISVGGESSVDLGVVTDRVANELRLAHPGRTLTLAQRGDARGYWNEVRMEQVVSNLLGNALRHGTPAEPIRVEIDGEHAKDLALTMTNGGEIDPSVRSHLFEPFQASARALKRQEGLGLGLYIADEVVKAHGGHIDVSSGGGLTTFRLVLPRGATAPGTAA